VIEASGSTFLPYVETIWELGTTFTSFWRPFPQNIWSHWRWFHRQSVFRSLDNWTLHQWTGPWTDQWSDWQKNDGWHSAKV